MRLIDRLHEITLPMNPVGQSRSTQVDPRQLHTLMLTVEGKVEDELVDQKPCQHAYVRAAPLQHGRRGRRTEELSVRFLLVDLADVAQNHVGARPLRQPIGHLLPHRLVRGQVLALQLRVRDQDLFHRNRGVEA